MQCPKCNGEVWREGFKFNPPPDSKNKEPYIVICVTCKICEHHFTYKEKAND